MTDQVKFKQLLSNKPTELSEDTDFFNAIPKAETILKFIEAFSESLNNNKILALYGNWGSGKTSLIKYIQKKLDSEEYKTIYFETWKYEKDDNLALSLVDVIINETDRRSKQIIDDFKQSSFSLFKNFAKSATFNLPLVSFNADTLLSGIEEDEKNKVESLSLHEKMLQFESNYKKIEHKIIKNSDKKIVIFIDDLDRCEPENILNLLSALKHFFSHGENTIFFCAIDKAAVTKAVQHKYQDVIKSEEYLEKIFDISFNMPIDFNIKDLLEYYFLPGPAGIIQKYLKAIDFTNPRHLKKVLNKYLVLKFIQDKGIDYEDLIPTPNENNWINEILILHFIILYEFDKDTYFELKDLDKRMHKFAYNKYGALPDGGERESIKENFALYAPSNNETLNLFSKIDQDSITKSIHLLMIIPDKTIEIDLEGDFSDVTLNAYKQYIDSFSYGRSLQTDLAKFIINNQTTLVRSTNNYKFFNLFKMVELYL